MLLWFLWSLVIENWNDSPGTVIPIIQKLLHAGLRIYIYRYSVNHKMVHKINAIIEIHHTNTMDEI